MRFVVLLFLALIAVIGYLANLNDGRVLVHLSRQSSVEISVVALALLSMAAGGVLVMLAVGVRETRNLFANWRLANRQKKEARIQELSIDAVNALLARRHRDAVILLEKILVLQPNHLETLTRLGNAYRLEKNYVEAIRVHRKARGVDEQNLEVLLALAQDLEEANRPEEAITTLRELLRLDDKQTIALSRLIDLYVKLGRWDEAHEALERLIPLGPQDPAAARQLFLGVKYELGRVWEQRGSMERARRYFRGAIKLDRNFLPAHIGLGDLLLRQGKTRQAARLWEKSYHLTRNLILLHRLEDLYVDTEGPAEMLRIYQEAVRHDPASVILKFFLGKLYYRLEMLDDAYDVLTAIDSSDVQFPDLHKLLGNIALRRGDLKGAVEEFKRALNLKKRVLVPYYCPSCDYHTNDWSGRCPRCGRWNSFEASPIIVKKSLAREPLQSLTF